MMTPARNIMKGILNWRIVVGFMVFSFLLAQAADKISVTINKQSVSAYRTTDLEAAKQEAKAAKKPIAWIASSPKLLDGQGSISQNNSRGATLHALYALRTKCVLVFM